MKDVSYGVCFYKITDTTEILLMRAKGHTEWGFIKGKIEENELKEECAIRECFEESGITVKPTDLEELFFSVKKRKNVGIFLVDSVNIDFSNVSLCPREVEEIRWFRIDEDIEIQKNQQDILDFITTKFIKRLYYFNKEETNK